MVGEGERESLPALLEALDDGTNEATLEGRAVSRGV
jgi:hypothetical protein